jgi:hypothetical protein
MERSCEPSEGGQWEKLFRSNVVGIHSALLHTGEVLFFSYMSKENHEHGHDDHNHSHGSADSIGDSEIIDIRKRQSQRINLNRNIFCGGTCYLEDGTLFVAGGQYPTFYSLLHPPCCDLNTFNPKKREWSRLKKNNNKNKFIKMKGRWYPTCVTLSDGRIIIFSGRYSFYQINFFIFRFVNNTLQIFNPKNNLLQSPQSLPFRIDLYPFVHLLPSGKIFVHSENISRIYDSRNNTWEKNPKTGKLNEYKTQYAFSRTNPGQGTCVLLPLLPDSNPPYKPRIMLIGGAGSNNPNKDTNATETAEIIDFSETMPEWRYTKPMNHPRVMPDSVILPDGNILIVNGSERGKSDQAIHPVFEPELFDPRSESWYKMCSMTIPRLYHATALLLYDGRVLTAGTDAEWNKPPFKEDQRNIEIFKPPYLFRGEQPEITDVPSRVIYNTQFDIKSPNSEDINSAILIHPGSVTHSVNSDQRIVGLQLTSSNSEKLAVRSPPNGNIAPPGYYMLFILNHDQVPSEARFIHLSHGN